MPRKYSELIDPAILKEANRKMNLRRQLIDLANRRFTDPAEKETFLNEEAPTLTPEEADAIRDAELLASVDPTR